MSATTSRMRRPGSVTLIGMMIVVQAAMAVVFGTIALVERDTPDHQLTIGHSSPGHVVFGVTELVIAVLLFVVAQGVRSGARGARTTVAFAMGVRMAASLHWLVWGHGDGVRWSAITTLSFSVFVLRALFGDDRSTTRLDRGAVGQPKP